jgi:hypothetical protein
MLSIHIIKPFVALSALIGCYPTLRHEDVPNSLIMPQERAIASFSNPCTLSLVNLPARNYPKIQFAGLSLPLN